MINHSEIEAALLNICGWRQEPDPDAPQVNNSLQQTSSGLYWQDRHPLITLENIRSISDNYQGYDYPAWADDATYGLSAKVRHEANNYISLQAANLDNEPGAEGSEEYWQLYDRMNEILEHFTRKAITNTVYRILTEKKVNKAFKSVLENKALIDGAARLQDKQTNDGSFVGFEITPSKSKNLKATVHRIGIQLDTPQTLRIYLFHTSSQTAISTKDITVATANAVAWVDVTGWDCAYDGNDPGGSFYIGYFQGDLTGQALYRDSDPSKGGCANCAQRAALQNQLLSSCLSAVPFKYKPTVGETLTTEMTWSPDDLIATPETNYGLNLVLSVYCDLTKTIKEQAIALAQPIRTQLAIDLLWEFAMNPRARVNRNQEQASQATILYELDGDSQGTKETGLRKEYEKELRAASFDLSELDRLCLPSNSTGVKYKTV